MKQFKDILKESKMRLARKGEVIVIHTSAYTATPTIATLKGKQIDDYFSDEMGFETEDAKKVAKLKSGEQWEFDGVFVIKL